VAATEPERELIRRVLPIAIAAVPVVLLGGALLGGWEIGLSAAIGVVVVLANFVAHGLSLSWAAKISLTVLYAVGLGGSVVRIGTIVVFMLALNKLTWFSQVAFASAVIPGTIALLVFEMKQLSGSMQADLWRFQGTV
jgi:hypothetical protein